MANHNPLESLLELISKVGSGSSNELQEMLVLANQTLGTEIGIISRIDGGLYTAEYVASPPDTLEAGTTFELGNTYCALTLKADHLVSIEHMGSSDHAGHPCYESFGLETYIGTPICLDGVPCGTVNFSANARREEPWTEAERSIVKLLAKFVEQELARQNVKDSLTTIAAELERVTSEQRHFISRLSHDLRAPLRNMRQLSEWLLEDEEDNLSEDGVESLQMMQRRALLAEELIRGLVTFARAGARQPDEDFSLEGVLSQVQRLSSKEITIALDCDYDHIITSRVALLDALTHLLNFAENHMREQITFSISDGGNALLIEVKTDGEPFPERRWSKIFESVVESEEPLGVSLALVRQRARAHGGEASIVHSNEESTIIHVSWPCKSSLDSTPVG